MNISFAPMEGITGWLYRREHHQLFHHVDRYYTPFLTPTQTKRFTPREYKDVMPEHNTGIPVVPQLLTNSSEDFVKAALELYAMGYQEVNLNLGCPSGTVVAKKKGSGFLACPRELDRFFSQVFDALEPYRDQMRVSVKTRLGKDDPEEFYSLAEIFNHYPICELIIHPRVQSDYYKNTPNLEVFAKGVALCRHPVCYNGDLFTEADYRSFCDQFPGVDRVMLGRGLVANPALASQIRGDGKLEKEVFLKFHDQLFSGYLELMGQERTALFKMKELWFYMGHMFEDSRKYMKRVKKAQKAVEYQQVIAELFSERELVEGAGFSAL